ncbi:MULTISPECIES: hypothetical protein [unclassified Serratia (in: enterobacteria)]|uniref:hypothetical protein n=1 Tax=unclassified Serratia (in: enterobacteria) TaxID=2647522 RepID=UPI00050784F4|nr:MULTISPECIES: hypothetical protein [unclassified Serratia (in: enterobacteria)]KFK91696.1 hypothetical protein JV45_24875 [Serratia sp. Ag2]KFK92208.1 hypothetical protein IV04_24880 [Serratia sp. Ag1]
MVESGAPDKIIERAAVWQKFSGQSASQMVQQWEQADFAVTPELRWLQDDSPVAQRRLSITPSDNMQSAKTTDTQGQVQPQSSAFIDTLQITSEAKE